LIPKGLLPGFVSEKPPYKNPYNPNSHPGMTLYLYYFMISLSFFFFFLNKSNESN